MEIDVVVNDLDERCIGLREPQGFYRFLGLNEWGPPSATIQLIVGSQRGGTVLAGLAGSPVRLSGNPHLSSGLPARLSARC
jgi:hypothetical protein